MKIAIGSDHAAFELKKTLSEQLKSLGHEILDQGTNGPGPVDYPDFAEKVARTVTEKNADRGLMLCGSGVGASIACNKVKGARAAICHDTYSAHQGVQHDDMNILVLGARVIGEALAADIVTAFINAQFSQDERHERRLNKIAILENNFAKKA